MKGTFPLTATRWQAIITNDASFDQQFFYAVKSTQIFCKPSCASRPPKKSNVTIYIDTTSALTAGYRPCKRCQPLDQEVPLVNWISDIKHYLEHNYQRQLNLELIASEMHSSPYYLHHAFKKQTGQTPLSYLTLIRISHAQRLLASTTYTVAIIGQQVGITNGPYFSAVFKKVTKQTPTEYRNDNKNLA